MTATKRFLGLLIALVLASSALLAVPPPALNVCQTSTICQHCGCQRCPVCPICCFGPAAP